MKGKLNWRWMIGVLMAFLLGNAMPVSSQCTLGGIPSVLPPSVTPIGAYKDLLRSPAQVAVDESGKAYITDPPSGRIFVRDAYGRLVFVMQGLAGPLGIAVDVFGYIYVSEEKTGSVTVFDTNWNFVRKLGQGDGEFMLPNHIAIDSDSGSVYVTDSRANVVKVFSSSGELGFFFGGLGSSAGQFNFPTGIFVRSAGEVFVADQNNERVQVFDRQGNFLRCFRNSGGMIPKFGRIQGLTGDNMGRVYVANTFQGYVKVFDTNGAVVSTIGSFGDGPGQLQSPVGLGIDRFNRLFVTSVGNTRVEIFGLDDFSNPTILQAIVELKRNQFVRSRHNESRGKRSVNAYIEIPSIAPSQINVSTVEANGVQAKLAPDSTIVDYDKDGIFELRVRFDRNALLSTVTDGEAILSVTGQLLDGTPFEGSALVTVLPNKGGSK